MNISHCGRVKVSEHTVATKAVEIYRSFIVWSHESVEPEHRVSGEFRHTISNAVSCNGRIVVLRLRRAA